MSYIFKPDQMKWLENSTKSENLTGKWLPEEPNYARFSHSVSYSMYALCSTYLRLTIQSYLNSVY